MGNFVELMNIDQINAEMKNIMNVINNPKFKEWKKFLNDIEISLEFFPFHQEDMVLNENGENAEGEEVCMKKIFSRIMDFSFNVFFFKFKN